MKNISEFAELLNVACLVMKYEGDDYYIVYANRSFLNEGRFKAEKLIGDKVHAFSIIHVSDRDSVRAMFAENAKDGASFDCTFRASPSISGYFWYKAHISVREHEGELYYFGIFINITDLKVRERELFAREEMQNLALGNTDINTFTLDLNARSVTMSENYRRIHGISSTNLGNYPDCLFEGDHVRLESIKTLKNMIKRMEAGERKVEGDIWFRASDRHNWWCERVSFTTIFDLSGKPTKAIGICKNITDEINARAEKIKFETALNNSEVLLWEYDIETKTCINHKRAADVFGILTVVENAPQSIVDMGLVATSSVGDYIKLYEAVKNGEERVSADVKMYDANYNEVWYRMTLNTVFDDSGTPVRAVGCAVDLTASKEIEEKYETEFTLQNEMVGDTVIAKVRLNLTEKSVESYVSKDNFGCISKDMDYDEAISRLASTALLPTVENAIKKVFSSSRLLKRYAEGKNQSVIEYKRKTRDGKVQWVRTEMRCFEKPGRGDIIVFAYTYDINDEKLMKQVLDELMDTAYDFFAVIDVKDDKITFIGNRRLTSIETEKAERVEKYSTTIERRVKKYIVPEQVNAALSAMDLENVVKVLKKRQTHVCTFKASIPGSDALYFRWRYSYLDENETQILFTRSNVTDTIEAEVKQNETLQDALMRANEANEAKSEFLSRMSHDMRTPMNGILGLLSLTLDMDMPRDVRENVLKMDNSGKYLLSLINDTLDMNKIESKKIKLNCEPVSGAELVANFISAAELTAKEKGVVFTTRLNLQDSASECVSMDKLRVQQILNNIVSNAIKFTEPGGNVTVDMNVDKSDGKTHALSVVVTDSGCGISPEFMPKLFEPFEQENNKINMITAGTGLGMSIVKSLLDMMGGTIDVQSEQGKGTKVTVNISFPVVQGKAKAKRRDTDLSVLADKHILVCEDHPLNAEIARALLTKIGCKVTLAENGQEGVKLFAESRDDFFDAVLMDIRMPVMDGLQASAAIRALDRADAKRVPIVAMTANAFASDVEKSIAAGMDAHLAKPIEPTLMYQTVAELINTKLLEDK